VAEEHDYPKRDPIAAARAIAAGQVREVDLGEVNGHLFWNVASIGFSVELAQDGRIERVRTVQVTVGNGRLYGGDGDHG
jgi:diacylglycerol kinase family enzyme